METRTLDITMAERIRKYGMQRLRASDGSGVKLLSKTGVDINGCPECIHEENCPYAAEYGDSKMPCEYED